MGIMHIYPNDYLLAITEIDEESIFEIDGSKIVQITGIEFFEIGRTEPTEK